MIDVVKGGQPHPEEDIEMIRATKHGYEVMGRKQEIRTLQNAIAVLERIKLDCDTGEPGDLVTIQNAIDGVEGMGFVEYAEWETE